MKQFVVRQDEAAVRELESRARLKHNRKLIAELQIELHGKDKAVRTKRSGKTKRTKKTLQVVSRATQGQEGKQENIDSNESS